MKTQLISHYKEYCDEDEKSRSKSTKGSHARSEKRREIHQVEMINDNSTNQAPPEMTHLNGIKALKELLGDQERQGGNTSTQNSFQRGIDQCEAYFSSQIEQMKDSQQPQPMQEEPEELSQGLLEGMSSKKQEQFLMRDSLSPSYPMKKMKE